MQVQETIESAQIHGRSLTEMVVATFESLESSNIESLRQIYTDDVCFEDPAHGIQGLDSLISLFKSLYQNLDGCQFKFHKKVTSDDGIFLSWTMLIRHKKIRKGAVTRVEGASFLRARDGKIFYHRDYFDLGAMVYENVPMLGTLIRVIKSNLGQ